MKNKSEAGIQIRHNRAVHDSIVSSYENVHVEIFNPTEQARIASVLADAVTQIRTQAAIPLILDFGAGTGNLTKHLLNLGAQVISADVSQKSLAALDLEFGETERINTMELNGIDLSNLGDDSLDMVATYSVLHHVLDYLEIVKEFVRVVKPGGVVYIDHESAPGVWLEDIDDLTAYREELQIVYRQPFMRRLMRKLRLLFSYNAWKRLINRKFYDLNTEGDIHVYKDDHIEWNRVEELLLKQCVMIQGEDYLVCREVDRTPPLHRKYSAKCVDIRFVIYRKN